MANGLWKNDTFRSINTVGFTEEKKINLLLKQSV